MRKMVNFNLVNGYSIKSAVLRSTILNFGGDCHAGYSIKSTFKSPFQGLGVPTPVFPSFMESDWRDFFDIKNISAFRNDTQNVCVRDMKYNINSYHHFEIRSCDNLMESLEAQLPKFKEEFFKRWEKLFMEIKNPDNFIIYNEYYPDWYEGKQEGLPEAVEAILNLNPEAQLIVLCKDKTHQFKDAATVIRNPKEVVNKLFWGFITSNINERNFHSGRKYYFDRKIAI